MTSAPRVERVDDLVVDSQGLDPPTEKWLQAGVRASTPIAECWKDGALKIT